MISLLYDLFWAVVTFVFLILTVIIYILTVPFDPSRRVIHETSRVIASGFFRLPVGWKNHIYGLNNADPDKTYIIIINHCSMYDIPYLYWVKLNFRWVAKKELGHAPLFGQFIRLHGDILVDRGTKRGAIEVMQKGKMWLKRGVCIAMFPEGTRSKDGEIHSFKSGAFALAKQTGVGILPVVMSGTRDLLRKGIIYNWRHSLGIEVLEAISAETVASTSERELAETAHSRMVEAKRGLDLKIQK